jgi:hypothetical protein
MGAPASSLRVRTHAWAGGALIELGTCVLTHKSSLPAVLAHHSHGCMHSICV